MSLWFNQGMIFCWFCCCNYAQPLAKALYWRPVYLITLLQAQAWFKFYQPLPALHRACSWFCYLPALFGRGRRRRLLFFAWQGGSDADCSRGLRQHRGSMQLVARGTKERARLGWPFFGLESFILKTMLFRDITTVLNERKHLKMVIWSVPDSVSLILGLSRLTE